MGSQNIQNILGLTDQHRSLKKRT